MGEHIVDGEFQSDKYPKTPRGKVPLSIKDPTAQDLLWQYAQRRRAVDAAFADDLEACLTAAGYVHQIALDTAAQQQLQDGWVEYSEALRKTPAELVAAREVIAEARATIASHHEGIAPIDGLRSAVQRFDMRPADQPVAPAPPPVAPALSSPPDPALSTWAALGRLDAALADVARKLHLAVNAALAELRDGDLSLLRELRADAPEPEAGHGDDCWARRRLLDMLQERR